MKIIALIIFHCLSSLGAFACQSARQHKLFPIGIANNNIVFIEAHIHRTDNYNKEDRERHHLKVKWIIKTSISVYDKSQNLISIKEIDNSQIKGDSYLSLLKTFYTKGLSQIKSLYKSLDYFTADYMSFCDYQKKCSKVEMINDSIEKKDYLKYKNKFYRLKLNTSTKDIESAFYIRDLSYYFLNSIRIYKAKNIELLIGHAATGHEVSMGWITSKPNKKASENGDPIHKAKPYEPDTKLRDLAIPIYQEPLMHHGYGNDIFIVSEN